MITSTWNTTVNLTAATALLPQMTIAQVGKTPSIFGVIVTLDCVRQPLDTDILNPPPES